MMADTVGARSRFMLPMSVVVPTIMYDSKELLYNCTGNRVCGRKDSTNQFLNFPIFCGKTRKDDGLHELKKRRARVKKCEDDDVEVRRTTDFLKLHNVVQIF